MLSDVLKSIRLEMGYKSTLGFYQHLAGSAELDVNYSHYKKIENGEVIPSVKAINQFALLFEKAISDRIILAYCQTCFPSRKELFGAKKSAVDTFSVEELSDTVVPQKTLTVRQVHLIANTKESYFLFLILTVSREALSEKKLKKYFSESSLKDALDTLREAKILKEKSNAFCTSHSEYRFPKKDGSLESVYKKLDSYDLELNQFFNLSPVLTKQMFRRVSRRFMPLITSHISLLLKTIRMSEEADSDANTTVVSFSLNFSEDSTFDE